MKLTTIQNASKFLLCIGLLWCISIPVFVMSAYAVSKVKAQNLTQQSESELEPTGLETTSSGSAGNPSISLQQSTDCVGDSRTSPPDLYRTYYKQRFQGELELAAPAPAPSNHVLIGQNNVSAFAAYVDSFTSNGISGGSAYVAQPEPPNHKSDDPCWYPGSTPYNWTPEDISWETFNATHSLSFLEYVGQIKQHSTVTFVQVALGLKYCNDMQYYGRPDVTRIKFFENWATRSGDFSYLTALAQSLDETIVAHDVTIMFRFEYEVALKDIDKPAYVDTFTLAREHMRKHVTDPERLKFVFHPRVEWSAQRSQPGFVDYFPLFESAAEKFDMSYAMDMYGASQVFGLYDQVFGASYSLYGELEYLKEHILPEHPHIKIIMSESAVDSLNPNNGIANVSCPGPLGSACTSLTNLTFVIGQMMDFWVYINTDTNIAETTFTSAIQNMPPTVQTEWTTFIHEYTGGTLTTYVQTPGAQMIIGQSSAFDWNSYILKFSDIMPEAAEGVSTYLTGGNKIFAAQNDDMLKQAYASQNCPDSPFCGSIAINTEFGAWQGNAQPGGTISSIVPANTDVRLSYSILLITIGIRDWTTGSTQSILPSLQALQSGGGYFYKAFAKYLAEWAKTKKILIRFGYEMCATYATGNECDTFEFTSKVHTQDDMKAYIAEYEKFQNALTDESLDAALVLTPLGSVKNTQAFVEEFMKKSNVLTHFGVDMVLNATKDARSPVNDVFNYVTSQISSIVKVVPESSVNVELQTAKDLMTYLVDSVNKNNVKYWCYINRNNLGGGFDINSRLEDASTEVKEWWRNTWAIKKSIRPNVTNLPSLRA